LTSFDDDVFFDGERSVMRSDEVLGEDGLDDEDDDDEEEDGFLEVREVRGAVREPSDVADIGCL
jgi:hypothetical protein